jgi:hypothetical protein
MNALVWIALVLIAVTTVALTGGGPKGAKPVGRTRLMGTARYVLVVGIVVCGALGVFGVFRH